MTDTVERPAGREAETITRVVVRFAGDSGDGMQLTGDRFTSVSASFGNDLSTLPEFPAEIRAPAGTVNGVSSFQVHISDHDITTPGDAPSVLVAMNPAALKADLGRLEPHGLLIVNSDAFDERDLAKAGYAANPLDDDSLAGYRVVEVPMTSLTQEATEPLGVKPRDAERSKNFFALGLCRGCTRGPTEPTLDWIDEQVQGRARPAQQRRRVQRRLQLRRDHRAVRPPLTRSSRPSCRRASTRTSPATPRWRGASSPPASWPSCRCSSAATRSRRPPTSSTSCPSTSTSACARCRPKTRSPPPAWRSAPRSPATSASPPPAVRASR